MMTVTEPILLEFPAKQSLLGQMRDSVGDEVARLVEEDAGKIIFQVKLAIHEICANIVEHGYGDIDGAIQIAISLNNESGRLTIEVSDTAPIRFDPRESLVAENQFSARGRGLDLACQLMDELSFTSFERQIWRYLGKGEWELTGGSAASPVRGNVWRLEKAI